MRGSLIPVRTFNAVLPLLMDTAVSQFGRVMELTLDSRDEQQAKKDGPDGFTASTIFKSAAGCQGLTYDDVILMPGERDYGISCAFSSGSWWALLLYFVVLLIVLRVYLVPKTCC